VGNSPANDARLTVVPLGRMAYGPALEVQRRMVERVKAGRDVPPGDEFLLLVEHDPPAITIGRGGDGSNVVVSREQLSARGFDVHESSRGGDVTYHGPGQLVAYPVIDLTRHGRDVHRYLRDLEQVVLNLLSRWDIEAGRDERYTGAWVASEKVCAIGVAITRWVTYHGLALNVTTDLSHFDLIVPCGITDGGVTSLTELLGREVPMDEVRAALVEEFATVFEFSQVSHRALDELESRE
jgi:lipoate-protein ligase B